MTWWQRIWRRKKMDEELEKELRFHLDLHTADLIAHGLDPQEARRRARLALGGPEQVKEKCRDARGTRWLEDLLRDFRYAVRTLARTPGFTAIAIATLALCIGINTVVFTFYDSVAFRRLPVRAPEEMVRFQRSSGGFPSNQFSWSEYERLATTTSSFGSFIATSTPQTIICRLPESNPGSAEVVHVRWVSDNYFDALGIRPDIGRPFRSDDRVVAMVSYDFWQRKL